MKDELPGGYGFTPKPKPKPSAEGPLHEHPVGALEHVGPAIRATVLAAAIDDVQMELELFATSGDSTHVWRAWRTARVFGPVPSELLTLIAPHLDALAARDISSIRVPGRENTYLLLAAYDSEVAKKQNQQPGCAPTLVECRKRAGKPWGKTEGAVKQLILKRKENLAR